ncbi:unnamed protein product [Gongylonema pulchrum]|uniref:G protein-coupled receptor n=1 Tax=Gongylonema pulchrum TaxID=637853 RepID=A0A183CUC1_9BILA|nr:unnamed protein product [Gongylonema pulchrum]
MDHYSSEDILCEAVEAIYVRSSLVRVLKIFELTAAVVGVLISIFSAATIFRIKSLHFNARMLLTMIGPALELCLVVGRLRRTTPSLQQSCFFSTTLQRWVISVKDRKGKEFFEKSGTFLCAIPKVASRTVRLINCILQIALCPVIMVLLERRQTSVKLPFCSQTLFSYGSGKATTISVGATCLLLFTVHAILLILNILKKIKFEENIRTTKLMFATAIASCMIILYMLPVFLIHGVDIDTGIPLSNATMQRIIAYAPWETSTVCLIL